MLSFSLKSPPYIAVCIGDNYMLVFGTSGQHSHEDVGLTFPEDYGAISNPNPNPSPNPNPTLTLTLILTITLILTLTLTLALTLTQP